MSTTTAGPETCFEELLDGCLPRLRQRIARWVRRHGAAVDPDDVLHDTIVRALEHRELFATKTDLLRWCTTTAHRRLWEILRSPEEVHHVPVADVTDASEASGEFSPDTAVLVERAADVVAVQAAIARLSDRDRRLIEARYFRRLHQHEIAAEMHLSVPNVNKLMERARVKLRAALRPVHLAVAPLFARRARRSLRRGLWPTQFPMPVLATSAVVVGLSAVFQYAVPLELPAEAQEIPAMVAPRSADGTGRAPQLILTPTTVTTRRPLTVEPGGGDGEPPRPPMPPPFCQVTCLPAPPTPPVTPEDGDTITLTLPPEVEQAIGPVFVREEYTPVCEHWQPNPAASCQRTGHPHWTVPPGHTAATRPDHPTKEIR